MKALIVDTLPNQALQELKYAGIKISYDPKLKGINLAKEIYEFQPEVLVVRETTVDEQIIDSNDSLRFVVRAGTSVENIDFNHCSTRGIFVANCPKEITFALSEMTLGLMLAVDRRIVEGANMLKQGQWNAELFR